VVLGRNVITADIFTPTHAYDPAAGDPLGYLLEQGHVQKGVDKGGDLAFVLANGNLGAVVSQVDRIARQTLPSTITYGFSGQAQAFQSSQGNLGILLLVTVFVIYIILGILYESFIHPITILTGLPFATFGALLALFVTRVELDVYAYVGIIMLIGIVKKNAIMMIDFALDRQRNEHVPPAVPTVEAPSVRFRPTMMTTVSAIVAMLPIAIGVGASAAPSTPGGRASWPTGVAGACASN